MDKNVNILNIKNRKEVVFGNNKKFLGFKNNYTDKVEYQEGILPIVANNNAVTITGTTGGTNVVNVLTNDTLGGGAATTSNVNLTTVTPNAKLTLNSNGSVNVANPTTAGTYTLVYQICQKDRPDNCSQATLTVTVS